jgi:putative transposase
MRVGQGEPRSVRSLCLLLGYSRQALYQYKKHAEQEALGQELLLQQVYLLREKMKRCGGRKLFELLGKFRNEHGIKIGRDGFFELLREHGLLVRKRKRSSPVTTMSRHWMYKYSNLIKYFIPTSANQLWVSDITYIGIGDDFAYLSLVTDCYSHKIMGFYLCEDLKAEGCIVALKMALQQLGEMHRLIHHSDRGVQYCSEKYVTLLKKNNISISMTQSGNPRENPVAERANGILKDEFLFDKRFADIDQARKAIATVISTYNHLRPHLSIDMLTPAQAHLQTGEIKKRWKNYYAIKKRKEVPML